MYTSIQSKMCKELEAIEEKYRSGAEMSEGDLRKIDLLTHSMKSLATYIAMKEAEEYNNGGRQQAYTQNMNNSYNNSYSDHPYNTYMNNSYRDDTRRQMPYYPEERRW